MFTKYHLDIRYLGTENEAVKYSVNKEVIEFSPGELRNGTQKVMEEYITNTEIVRQERTW